MRNILIITAIISGIFLPSCKDKIELPEDEIIYSEINKIVTVANSDSVITTRIALVFKIDTCKDNNNNKQVAVYRIVDSLAVGDGYEQISTSDDKATYMFNKSDIIPGNNLWADDFAYLDNFAGKGEKFIGYRAVATYNGLMYYYSWIKVELSADKSQLRIISMADNLVEGNPIKAGQVE